MPEQISVEEMDRLLLFVPLDEQQTVLDSYTEDDNTYDVPAYVMKAGMIDEDMTELRDVLAGPMMLTAGFESGSEMTAQIEEQMKSQMYKIGNEVHTIRELPEFSFEAMETYKKTLDLAKAIQEGQRLSEIQKRKALYEEEQKRKAEELKKQPVEAAPEPVAQQYGSLPAQQDETVPVQTSDEQVMFLDFRAWGTREQLMKLRQYMIDNKIRFGKVE